MGKRKKEVEEISEVVVLEASTEVETASDAVEPAVEKEPEVTVAPTVEAKPVAVQAIIPTWEDIRDRVSSISAMKRDLTGERITYGDALAIYKTDAHRRLYEEWAKTKRQKK